MSKKNKAPYKLIIHTNSYTGNFERELVVYSIGILDDLQKGYANDYKKAFWTSYSGSSCTSLDQYNEFAKICNTDEVEDMLSSSSDEEFEEKKKERKLKRKEERDEADINCLYDTYSSYTYQQVDDWDQETFYNIETYKGEGKCDSVIIQLNKPSNETFEELVIGRIKNFFEVGAYNIIKNFEWLCSFGRKYPDKENYKLLDLELVDSNNEVIKKYV